MQTITLADVKHLDHTQKSQIFIKYLLRHNREEEAISFLDKFTELVYNSMEKYAVADFESKSSYLEKSLEPFFREVVIGRIMKVHYN